MPNITEPLMLFMFSSPFSQILSGDATSHLKLFRHIISPSDTLTYPGGVWRSSEEASEGLSTSRPLLLWAAGLLILWGLEVNKTRPNLASNAPQAARNQSETPSLFRAPWILAVCKWHYSTPSSTKDLDRERGDSQNVLNGSAVLIII